MSRALTINGTIVGVESDMSENLKAWSNILRDVRRQWAEAEEYRLPKGKKAKKGNGGSGTLVDILHDVSRQWAEAEESYFREKRSRR